MTTRMSDAEREARDAGADSAARVIAAQIRAGMPVDRIEQSAERVLADQHVDPTPVSEAFYGAYAAVADAYVTAARQFDLETWHVSCTADARRRQSRPPLSGPEHREPR